MAAASLRTFSWHKGQDEGRNILTPLPGSGLQNHPARPLTEPNTPGMDAYKCYTDTNLRTWSTVQGDGAQGPCSVTLARVCWPLSRRGGVMGQSYTAGLSVSWPASL